MAKTELVTTRLHSKYKKEIVQSLQKEFSYKNVMQVPKLSKIVLSMSTADALGNAKILNVIQKEFSMITGQHALITTAKKSIASFKLRAGQPLGITVTLRKQRMYEFLDRFINIVLPRVRDFKGVSDKAFDGRGNYSLGLKEQLVFPEIDYNKVDKTRGMNITFVTTAETNEESYSLLKMFGLPFKKK